MTTTCSALNRCRNTCNHNLIRILNLGLFMKPRFFCKIFSMMRNFS